MTRSAQEHESRSTQKPVRMLERSVFSDRHVFVRAVHENEWLSEAELQIYDSWFHPFIECVGAMLCSGVCNLTCAM